MKVDEFYYLANNSRIENQTRVWLFGIYFEDGYDLPLLFYTFSESEFSIDEYGRWNLHQISPKTDRALKSKTFSITRRYGDRGNLNRADEFELFLNKDEAIARYREVVAQKTEQANDMMETYVRNFNRYIEEMNKPLDGIDAE